MLEKELQKAIGEMAQFLGWRVAHFRTANTGKGYRTPVAFDGKGFPDLVLARDEDQRVVFIELKGEGGRLSPDQREWMRVLQKSGAEYHLLTPKDWTSGHVDRILARPKRPPA